MLRRFHSPELLKSVRYLSVLSLIPIIILLSKESLVTIAVSILAVLLIAKVGQHVAQHRYFAHRSFKTGKRREWLLGILGTLSTTGSPIHYAAMHRTHHRYSDTKKDFQSPVQGFFKSFFANIDPSELTILAPPKTIKDLLSDSAPAKFFHDYYWHTIILYCSILALISPLWLLYGYVLPVGVSVLLSGLLNTITHMFGYQARNTGDISYNNHVAHVLTLGEGMHNNHHFAPDKYDTNIDGKWYEFDPVALIIRLFFLKT